MRIDRVTITGADESIGRPENLFALTEQFPFVEWGILASARNSPVGGARFPGQNWLRDLLRAAEKHPMNLSLHLCGRWVRDLLLGDLTAPEWLVESPKFQRVQLNFHAERTMCNPHEFSMALLSLGAAAGRQFIFQIDGANGNKHLEAIYAENHPSTPIDAVPLFDVSGGAGIVPETWPKPRYMSTDIDHCYHGYAGGLGPDILEKQLPLIAEAAGNTRIWIDMETHVRSTDDLEFDLGKVRRCLEICAPHIAKEKSHV